MIIYTRLIILLSTMVLLSACQSTPANSPDVVFKDEGASSTSLEPGQGNRRICRRSFGFAWWSVARTQAAACGLRSSRVSDI